MEIILTKPEYIAEAIKKCRKGNFVLWEQFLKEMDNHLFRFTGVWSRYNIDFERAERRIKQKGRYYHTKAEIADVLGVSRTTLSNWESGDIVTLKRMKPPTKYYADKYTWVYDAKDVLEQLKFDKS
ncbi:MAG: helix-turn-helix transcriptional regulator [Alphaproteobacteria bacterium]|nr:helix-turn-helix transcriptional regulator [Alphaproteobacteria bacterium]